MSPRLDTVANGAVTTASLSGWNSSGWRRQVTRQSACAAALIASDSAAFGVSAATAWLVAVFGPLAMPQLAGRPAAAMQVIQSGIASVFILGGLLAYFMAQGHYRRRLPFWRELQQVLTAVLFALLCNSLVEFAFKTDASRAMVLGTWILFPAALVALRQLTRRLLSDAGLWQIRAIIVGRGAAAERVAKALTSERNLGYTVVGIANPAATPSPAHRPWTRLLQQHRADLLIIAPEVDQTFDRSRNEALVRERVPFAVMPQAEGLPVSGCVQTYFFRHDLVMLSYRNNISQPVARAAKMALDLVGAASLVLFVSPVLLTIAAAVKLDGGPVFFAHSRIGAGGRRFRCLKFRSMRVDSVALLDNLLQTDEGAAVEWAATQKLRHDPRVTRIGAWLRKTSLDELPQLFNVLRLEMSLVGPRPIVESELGHYGDDIAYYYETRPGLTGLWQVSGRSDTSYRQRVQLDTWYVKNWTLWHDIAILAKTVPAVLNRTGAV